jgi:hypothetical protein
MSVVRAAGFEAPVNRRPRSTARLVRELSILVVLKLLILSGLYWAFFSSAHRLTPDSTSVSTWLLAAPPPPSH